MTSVHRVVVDTERFAYLDVHDREAFLAECPFDGSDHSGPLPEFFVAEPDLPEPQIWSISGLSHAIAVRHDSIPQRVRPQLLSMLVETGKDKWVNVGDEQFVVCITNEVVQALDRKRAVVDENGVVSEYAFHPRRVRPWPFKIMETREHELLSGIVENVGEIDQFVTLCKMADLTGVSFEEVWSDD